MTSTSAMASTSTAPDSTIAHARPPKPPLTSIPSSPGLDVPGGYPRNSTVFAGNKWERGGTGTGGDGGSGFLAAAKAYLPGVAPPIAEAKGSLPPKVASYFPPVSTSLDRIAAANANKAVHTPYPLNTDGSATSELSAYSDSGTPTPTPSEFPPVTSTFNAQEQEQEALPSTPEAQEAHPTTPGASKPAVESAPAPATTSPLVPVTEDPRTELVDLTVSSPTTSTSSPEQLPSSSSATSSPRKSISVLPLVTHPPLTSPPAAVVSPSASTSASSSSGSDANTLNSGMLSTPPTSPDSPASPSASPVKSPSGRFASGLARFASLRRSPAPSSPPSAFAKSTTASPSFPSGRASLESSTPPVYTFTPIEEATPPPKRRTSLLRTLRGEATVLTGKRTDFRLDDVSYLLRTTRLSLECVAEALGNEKRALGDGGRTPVSLLQTGWREGNLCGTPCTTAQLASKRVE
ncbi:hypothetical protein FB451DRAFT_1482902 [Mycena latifolia]|nr:hypothetical protein FB451DRAFT_1482902 [Mycena latifolia]